VFIRVVGQFIFGVVPRERCACNTCKTSKYLFESPPIRLRGSLSLNVRNRLRSGRVFKKKKADERKTLDIFFSRNKYSFVSHQKRNVDALTRSAPRLRAFTICIRIGQDVIGNILIGTSFFDSDYSLSPRNSYACTRLRVRITNLTMYDRCHSYKV